MNNNLYLHNTLCQYSDSDCLIERDESCVAVAGHGPGPGPGRPHPRGPLARNGGQRRRDGRHSGQ